MYRAEHRALRELHATGRQLAGHWWRLGDRLGGAPADARSRTAPRSPARLVTELAKQTAERGLHGFPAAQTVGCRLAGLRNTAADLVLERNQALRARGARRRARRDAARATSQRSPTSAATSRSPPSTTTGATRSPRRATPSATPPSRSPTTPTTRSAPPRARCSAAPATAPPPRSARVGEAIDGSPVGKAARKVSRRRPLSDEVDADLVHGRGRGHQLPAAGDELVDRRRARVGRSAGARRPR